MSEPKDIIAQAWTAAFGDISDLNWDTMAREAPAAAAASHTGVRAVTSVIAPPLSASVIDSVTRPKRTNRSKRATTSCSLAPTSSSLAPTSSSLAPASCSLAPASSLLAPASQFLAPTSSLLAPSSFIAPPLTSSCVISTLPAIQDPLAYLLETFDSLIAPQLPNPADSTASSCALRRCMYRKQFSIEASRILQSHKDPITSVEQLIPLVHATCAKCNILLA